MAAVFLYFYAPFVVFVGFLLPSVVLQKILCPANCSCLGSMVDCSKLGLTEVPKDLPNWVTILALHSNSIKEIQPDAFESLDKLEQLYLSNNQLKSLNSTIFQHLPNLKTLKLSYNVLTEIPYIQNGGNLSYLILHHNQIENINGDALDFLPRLRTLDLNFNAISEIPLGTFSAECPLHQLFLNNNKVATLEKGSLDNLTSLEYLKMNKNKLSIIPKDVFQKMINLKYLELNRNRIRTVEGLSFHGLEKLRVLKLRRNVITQLMDGAFWGLGSIQQLKLDNNNLTTVAKGWLYGLSSLQQLSLAHNNIQQIDADGWEFCQLLWELDLSHNKITGIGTATFDRLKNLSQLSLDFNKVSYIGTGAFKGLTKLAALDMNNNEISWTIEDMNGAFDGLTSLTKLGLDSNRITSIAKKAFMGLDMLKTLHLTDNAISSIQSNAFQIMKDLQELRFNSTNLLCDCHLSWLADWLIRSGFQSSVNARCGHPVWLKGKSIFEIKADDFKCDDFPKPIIIDEPKSQIALRGGNVTLKCSVASSSNSPMQFSWRKDNVVVKDADVENYASTGDGTVMKFTTLLHMKNIRDEDEGRYQCIITNEFGTTYSQKSKITVHVFPTFTKTPLDVTVKSGSTARLECAAQGQPQPEIAWQKDGGDDFPAARERRMHVMPTDDVFFIVNVKSSDEGMYSCTATNAAGTIIANATLSVLETPSFVKMMKDKRVKAGETAVLECMATGSPKPKLSWLKNGKPLEVTPRHFFTAEGQLLIIVQTEQSDSGRYTCEMTNTLGTESDSSVVTVIGGEAAQQTGLGGGGGLSDQSTTIGIIIIAVVCCVVGTSLVWVIIIYQTRKKHEEYSSTPTDEITLPVESSTGNSYQSSEKDEGHPPSPESLERNHSHTLLSFSGHNLNFESLPNGKPMCNGHVARYLSDLEDMQTTALSGGEESRPLNPRSAASLNNISVTYDTEQDPMDQPPLSSTFQPASEEQPFLGQHASPLTIADVHRFPSSSSLSRSQVHPDQSTLGGYHGTQPPGTYTISPTDGSVHPSHQSECATSPQSANGGIHSNGVLPNQGQCSSLSPLATTQLILTPPHSVNTHQNNGLESHRSKQFAASPPPHSIPNGHSVPLVSTGDKTLPNRTFDV